MIKPVIDFSLSGRTLKIEKAEGTINRIPINITGTLEPFTSSNPELDITAGLNGKLKTGVKITGTLNNPSFSLMNSSGDSKPASKPASQDIKIESHDTEIISTDVNHIMSEDNNNDNKKDNKKEELSKDENAAN